MRVRIVEPPLPLRADKRVFGFQHSLSREISCAAVLR
jgi:hypothetical protein